MRRLPRGNRWAQIGTYSHIKIRSALALSKVGGSFCYGDMLAAESVKQVSSQSYFQENSLAFLK